MKPFGLSSNALALAIGVTAARVNELVSGKRGITADTALRLARYFGTDPHSWMNLQLHYELELAERRIGDALARIQPRAA
jgi:antitoxin HigA-1